MPCHLPVFAQAAAAAAATPRAQDVREPNAQHPIMHRTMKFERASRSTATGRPSRSFTSGGKAPWLVHTCTVAGVSLTRGDLQAQQLGHRQCLRDDRLLCTSGASCLEERTLLQSWTSLGSWQRRSTASSQRVGQLQLWRLHPCRLGVPYIMKPLLEALVVHMLYVCSGNCHRVAGCKQDARCPRRHISS
jgi:hypothetical protein